MREAHHNRQRGYGYVILLASMMLWGVGLQAGENNVNNVKSQALLKHPERIVGLVTAGKLQQEQIPNPHWAATGCVACHARTPDKRGLHLRNTDVDALCHNCHTPVTFHDYIHPVGIRPGKDMFRRMSPGFRKAIQHSKGKLSCTTCHDLPKQCLGDKLQHERDPRFFRDGPYESRNAICYQCHDAKAYVRLNPHDQVDKQGQIRKGVCAVCHRTVKGLAQSTRFDQVDFNVTQDLATMCTGCHPYKPHPGGGFSFLSHGKNEESSNHLVKPPAQILQHLLHQEQVNHLVMPLDPTTGKIFCATCHNPHAKGVIRNAAAAKGAGSKKRLRTVDLCEQCHDK